MKRQLWLGAMLSALALMLGACSSASSTSTSNSSAASGGAVVGVAIPSNVAVVTANNAN